ncbi:MAG: bifunctional riboflavin kinase/FAD synthetase [Lachnospiraceae bacterium]|nr:bifunctional riboflavin kinase/FAD synthetase [Lachnospiraceae bacterium]
MEILTNIREVKLNSTIVTVGKFDGLHKGHAKLFDVLSKVSENRDKVVLTFEAKPIDVINNMKTRTLVTEKEKQLLCEAKGIDYYISLPLDKDFLDLSPEAFVKDVLVDHLDVRVFVCGPDFTFGKFGAGNVKLLQKLSKYYDFEVVVVEKEQYHNFDIGSTEIRKKITEGNIEEANEMLGHSFSVIGIVEEGKKLGRTIGIPTANVIPDSKKILPPNGAYCTRVIVDGKVYGAVSNVGVNPTVEDGRNIKIESHIFDFSGDIYGKIIKIEFVKFMRKEQKFTGVDELKNQIENDIKNAKEILA